MPTFDIVPERSMVVIDARSSLHPIHAECRGLQGSVDVGLRGDGTVDAGAEAKGRVELPTDRLVSGNPLVDREMRRRIDARRYPVITGVLTSLAAGDGPDRFRVAGDVTFHGTTRHYEEAMVITATSPGTLGLSGSHVFDVRDFGLEPPRVLMLRVEPMVTVRIDVEARRAG